jgi:hypothetical protein
MRWEGKNKGDEEWVRDRVERLQKNCGVVENEIHTSPLLHHLERCTKNGTAQVRRRLSKSAFEAIGLDES